MKKIYLFTSMIFALIISSCETDDQAQAVAVINDPEAGTLTGGPFYFCVDGTPDMVSGLTLDASAAEGANSTWVITDADGNILGLPPTLEAVEGVDFDEAGPGVCLIWYLRYEDGLEGAEMGMNANDFVGDFDLSDPVTVNRNKTQAGVLSGGPFEFTIDGTPDMVSGITLDSSEAMGTNSAWVITDANGNILGLPPTLEAVEGVNFDEAGAGVCLIWYLRYEDGLQGAEMGMNASDLEGCFSLSNSITVTRNGGVSASAGTLSGGPFSFCVDGTSDFVSDISLDSSEAVGNNSTWVITDADGNILGLPPTLEAVEGVDFDGAGAGVCLIWYARYEGEIEGAEMGMNANDINGNFALSNPLTVTRTQPEAGTLSGGDFHFIVDDAADYVSGIMLDSSNNSGSLSTWLITDEEGNILGLPPTLEAVEGVDFNAAGVGVCLIWYLRYEEGLQGAEMGMNAGDLEGCYDISNSIRVERVIH